MVHCMRALAQGRVQRSMVPATFVQSKLVLRGLVLWEVVPASFVQPKLVPWGRVQWTMVPATFVQSKWVLRGLHKAGGAVQVLRRLGRVQRTHQPTPPDEPRPCSWTCLPPA